MRDSSIALFSKRAPAAETLMGRSIEPSAGADPRYVVVAISGLRRPVDEAALRSTLTAPQTYGWGSPYIAIARSRYDAGGTASGFFASAPPP